ncbi:MAG: type II toxin-antitoxin system VapC family toxin [Xanthomonadales bacterium]|nr:type II toxin-antitoxin system VapC family toxin [Xanthomonadales bacterium]
MYITIDTSALIAVIGNEASNQSIVDLTANCSLYAPALVHWEIGNAFSSMFKSQKLDIKRAQQALTVYSGIPIKFVDVPLKATLGLSKAQNIYAYDAYLIQCAQQTSTSLLTLDNGLKSVAQQVGVHVLEVMQ